MAYEKASEIPESYPMKSGDGVDSYAQNSSYQRGVIDAAKAMINKGIAEKFELTTRLEANNNYVNEIIFRIADFGCSTGPNTFIAMQNIVEALELKYMQNPMMIGHKYNSSNNNKLAIVAAAEFQVFFNDHVDNDFNTLFRSLPPSHQHKYFVCGVAGSFHGRLFPKSSLHFVHCSYALHWLSKVPSQVQDRNSPAWNKGQIHYTGTEQRVVKAYFDQFRKDMCCFLQARAEELVQGGLMVIQMPALPNSSPNGNNKVLFCDTGAGMHHKLLGSSIMDLVNMGIISEERVDAFNIPQYHPTVDELKKLIESNNSFSIQMMETIKHSMDQLPFDVKRTSSHVRAVLEAILEKQFGNGIMDQLFDIFTRKLEENRLFYETKVLKDVDLFILLKRKQVQVQL